MNVATVHHQPAPPLLAGERSLTGVSFRDRLQSATRPPSVDEAREAAQQIVATTFVAPILASMRESPFQEGPFAPGTAERRFTPLLDRHMADRITQSANFPLVDSVIERVLSMNAAGSSTEPPTSREP